MAPIAKRPRTVVTLQAKERNLPVILITGFLGAGKTTLVNQVLRSRKHIRAAVFVNEYGAADVDGEIVRWQGEIERRQVLTVKDGCMCCGGKDDLRTVLEEEFADAKAAADLDVLIIETSGVCDPVPVIATLAEARGVYLDSVVVVFDATTLDDATFGASEDAQRQLKCADILLLSKLDLLADEAAADAAEQQLLSRYRKSADMARPEPRVLRRAPGQVTLDDLCEVAVLGKGGGAPKERALTKGVGEGVHSSFATHAYTAGRPFDRKRFEAWAASPHPSLVRAKGVLWVEGEKHGMVWHFAGGRSSGLHPVEGNEQPRFSELVFIGNYGDDWKPIELDQRLQECLVGVA